jgi:regulatory protein
MSKIDPRKYAISLLTRREHSRQELHRKLAAKGLTSMIIEHLLDRLESEGLLSDARFADSYVQARKQRGFGPVRITRELQERGVSRRLIQQHVDCNAQDWQEIAWRQYQKRFPEAATQDNRQRVRGARFLINRGFRRDVVVEVLNEMD